MLDTSRLFGKPVAAQQGSNSACEGLWFLENMKKLFPFKELF